MCSLVLEGSWWGGVERPGFSALPFGLLWGRARGPRDGAWAPQFRHREANGRWCRCWDRAGGLVGDLVGGFLLTNRKAEVGRRGVHTEACWGPWS